MFATYLIQILILAALGIVAGLVLGALIPLLALPFLPGNLVPAQLGFYPAPLGLAALFGLLTTLAFSLWPIAAACETEPAALFRATIEPPGALPRWPYRIATGVAALLLPASRCSAPTIGASRCISFSAPRCRSCCSGCWRSL